MISVFPCLHVLIKHAVHDVVVTESAPQDLVCTALQARPHPC